ncbi:YxeA family protein [Staphylococcus caeli]|uniref:DUF1093-containing protein n=1 Tax=Staphylococcus caeli TaxID=2201815 RepID=A0A1D4JAI4_9STAP|nr:YxeA family protein [Staphylococcus caeli]SCS40295.1 putative DUF1093-containing protein [Staphylococcus caeli]SCS58656.1 putative DUF1093-containing protein [Staphylococcus caeli]
MNKKFILGIPIILVLLLIFLFTFDKFDRFNPFLKNETSYAIVKPNTQYYQNVTIYSEQGEKRNYKLSFGGYDPSKQYVKLNHKGTYVKNIEYISKQNFPSLSR